MPKIRTIKPDFYRHPELFDTEQETGLPIRVAFSGLFTCCDREGRFKWEPRCLKLDILPYDLVDFSLVLDALLAKGFIKKYSHLGKDYGYIPTWHDHQCINTREPASKLPDPKKSQPLVNQSETMAAVMEDLHVHALALPVSNIHAAKTNSTVLPDAAVSRLIAFMAGMHVMHMQSQAVQNADVVVPKLSSRSLAVAGCHNAIDKPHASKVASVMPEDTTKEQKKYSYPVDKNINFASSVVSSPYAHVHAHATQNTTQTMHMHAHLEMEVEVEKELEVDRGKGKEDGTGAGIGSGTAAYVQTHSETASDVLKIFSHWQITLQHPEAVLDEKRKTLIQQALKKGYSVSQLCAAISGCAKTPYNMGFNDHGQRYDGLHVILRDADQIERFIRNEYKPPRPMNESDKLYMSNMAAAQSWLKKKMAGVSIYAS